jgi:ABC-type Fe3+-hydroxamate transport system substrate-binding protein
MRIVSLEPFITELVSHFGMGESLVGISHHPVWIEEPLEAPAVTSSEGSVEGGIASSPVSLSDLKDLTPDLILTSLLVTDTGDAASEEACAQQSQKFTELLGHPVQVKSYSPRTLEQVYDCYRRLAADLGVPEKGVRLTDIMKAEFLNWADNFYARFRSLSD